MVNPAAPKDKRSPIFGMPILNVDKVQHAIAIKSSMWTDFAGVNNELFYKDKTTMLFGSVQDVMSQLVSEIKQL